MSLIFRQTFEANTTAWFNTLTPNSGTIATSTDSVRRGNFGLEVTVANSDFTFAEKNFSDFSSFGYGFWFSRNDISFNAGEQFWISRVMTSDGADTILDMAMRNNAGVYQVRVRAWDDGGTGSATDYTTIDANWHWFWTGATIADNPGDNDGIRSFYIDGTEVVNSPVTTINDDTLTSGRIRLGVTGAPNNPQSGSMFYDGLVLRDDTKVQRPLRTRGTWAS